MAHLSNKISDTIGSVNTSKIVFKVADLADPQAILNRRITFRLPGGSDVYKSSVSGR
jgi:hypothetical protein